jgi:hypothetical protein
MQGERLATCAKAGASMSREAPMLAHLFTHMKELAMSIFGSILSKLGIGSDKTAEAAPAAPASVSPAAEAAPTAAAPAAPSAPAVQAISEVDVVAKLDALASAHAEKLNWKVSIVDLLKLLSLDSSLNTRKDMAAELGCPADKMGDSAQMNMWLHKTVMHKLAANGGNIPADLLN